MKTLTEIIPGKSTKTIRCIPGPFTDMEIHWKEKYITLKEQNLLLFLFLIQKLFDAYDHYWNNCCNNHNEQLLFLPQWFQLYSIIILSLLSYLFNFLPWCLQNCLLQICCIGDRGNKPRNWLIWISTDCKILINIFVFKTLSAEKRRIISSASEQI